MRDAGEVNGSREGENTHMRRIGRRRVEREGGR